MNKRSIYKIIANLNSGLRALNFKNIFLENENQLRVLNYHSIGGSSLGDVNNMFTTTYEAFKLQIEYLLSEDDIEIIGMDRIDSITNKIKVLITFDDGYLDNYTLVAPYLMEKQIPFSIFIATNYVKKLHKNFMSPAQLIDLSTFSNIHIGSHGKNHVRLGQCSNSVLLSELRDSKLYLEDLLSMKISSIAYPYGNFDRRVILHAGEIGYLKGFTTRYDVNRLDRNPLALSRYNVEADNDVRIINQKVHGDWDWYRFRNRDVGKI